MPSPPIPLVDAGGVVSLLHSAKRIVLSTHANPDGDALGSEYALACHLLSLGKQVWIINTDPVPENLAFLNQQDLFQTFDEEAHGDVIDAADLLVFPDLNGSGRVKRMEAAVLSSPAKRLVLDHHLYPLPFADWYHIVETASSTAEIVFTILRLIPGFVLTPEIALGLYTGIMTDTGSFRFESTTPAVHRIAAELLQAGVEPHAVYSKIYDEYPFARTQLLGFILSDMQILCDGKASILKATNGLFTATHTGIIDTENIVNYGLGIRGVMATAFLVETTDGIKVSFRSRGAVEIHGLAKQFGGGGHRYASGATLEGASMEAALRDVRAALCKLLE